jgi:ATP-binding cassette subfamily F protein 3
MRVRAMLTVSQLSKSFSGRLLFDEVSLQVNRGDRLGLVGPNGSGKSTLFSLILGEASPDSGQIMFEKSASVGFLPQETAAAGEETVLELALATTPELVHAQKIIKQHESGDGLDDAAYHRALHIFDEHGGWQLEPKAKRVLAGLAFRETDFERPARALSGGWIMRAHLARLLVMEPDLLLLDEPTNHLDLESLQWFQEYLKNYPGAIVMISHDREFLNQLVGSIVEIAHSKLIRYRGNWDSYVEQKSGARRTTALGLQESTEGNRIAAIVRRSLPRQGEQSIASAKQAEADRSHGKNRGADRARQNDQVPLPAAAAQRSACHRVERCRSCLCRSCRLSRFEFSCGKRTTHGAGRTKRRRKIHTTQIARRRVACAKRKA